MAGWVQLIIITLVLAARPVRTQVSLIKCQMVSNTKAKEKAKAKVTVLALRYLCRHVKFQHLSSAVRKIFELDRQYVDRYLL